MLLDERRRDEVAGRAAVQKDDDGMTADETSQLDVSARRGKLVDLRDGHGGRRWRCGGRQRGRLLFMPEAARRSGNLVAVGWHR